MGEFADMAIERDYEEWLDGGCSDMEVFYPHTYTLDIIEYLEIIRETAKAWLLRINRKFIHWFPKSRCQIDKSEKTISIPHWLTIEINKSEK